MGGGSIKTIGIVRALFLGDLLCSVPAWRALRAAFPEARISLIGLPWAHQFVARFHRYLDELIEFPGYPGLPERPLVPDLLPPFLAAMQKRRFDLLIQMHGSGRSINPLVALLGARDTAGFVVPGEYCPDPSRFMSYPDDLPEVHRHLRLMEFLGIPPRGDHLEFPLAAADERRFRALDETASLRAGDYVCVHPGGRGVNRRWAPERFAAVADRLAARGLRIVITGTAEEAGLVRTMVEAMRAPAVDLTGRTDLGTLGVLLRGARLLVANDTGVSHVSAALQVPSVVVVTGSDPVRWAPLDRRRHRICVGSAATVDRVLSEAEHLIEEHAVEVRA
ncbi:glycosyltransferase family 9 protein [Candidatus Nitrospira bockiana]